MEQKREKAIPKYVSYKCVDCFNWKFSLYVYSGTHISFFFAVMPFNGLCAYAWNGGYFPLLSIRIAQEMTYYRFNVINETSNLNMTHVWHMIHSNLQTKCTQCLRHTCIWCVYVCSSFVAGSDWIFNYFQRNVLSEYEYCTRQHIDMYYRFVYIGTKFRYGINQSPSSSPFEPKAFVIWLMAVV